MSRMKVSIYGLWHLGTVTAVGLAQKGFDVTAIDEDPTLIERLKKGQPPTFEPGLEETLLAQQQAGQLRFTTDLDAIRETETLWITVDTPIDEEDRADLVALRLRIEQSLSRTRDGMRVILSSQAPVGFTDKIEHWMHSTGLKAVVCYSPENLRLGQALKGFLEPDRIIVGLRQPEHKHFFEPIFSAISPRLEWMSILSAEMAKHAINSFLASSVVFANELGVLCDQVGADAREVERALKTELRIGPKAYVRPGAAFGGGTLARDVHYLLSLSQKDRETPSPLLNAILTSNRYHEGWTRRVLEHSLTPLSGRRIAVLGLTYKAGTDTLRRSWVITLCRWLQSMGVIVTAYDPLVSELPRDLIPILRLAKNRVQALEDADAAVIGVDDAETRALPSQVWSALRAKFIVDPNGVLLSSLKSSLQDIEYFAVGSRRKKKEQPS
jgi:UDPglucose 6-dehydrogenase